MFDVLDSAIPAYRQALNLAWYRAGRRILQFVWITPILFYEMCDCKTWPQSSF
jgi:hypothetical protein